MIPLKDDIPTLNKPVVRNYILAICVIVFILQIMSPGYRSGELFYSYGLIPSVLLGNQQLPENIYAIPAIATIFTSMFMHGGFMHLIGNMLYLWIFADNIEDDLGKKRKSAMKVNSVYGLLLAVQSGVGLAALPDYIAHNISNLTKVLPDEPGKPTETHFVYPASLKNNARLMAFRNFIFSKVNEWKF